MRSGRRKRIRDLVETVHSDILSDFEDELNQYRYTDLKQCSFQIFFPNTFRFMIKESKDVLSKEINDLSTNLL